ncbi:MAG: lysylphosphatidylglycerol synthase domain-containing protein [Candidatus Electrothrix sp. YB6]
MINSRSSLNILLSIGVSLLLLAFLLNGFNTSAEPAIRPKLVTVLSHTSWAAIGLYMLAGLTQTFLRTVRYRILLKNAVDDPRKLPGLFHLFIVTMSRNMFVDMLPARLGELSYVAMLNRGFRVGADACLSSLVISFVFDLLALALMLAGLIAFQLLSADVQLWLISTVLLLFLASGCALILLFPVLEKLSSRLRVAEGDTADAEFSGRAAELKQRLFKLIRDTSASLQQTAKGGITGQVLALSVGVRIAKYTGLYLLFSGVVASSFPDITREVAEVVTALVSAEAAAGLPVPAFMSFGTYEAGGTLALVALGVGKATSAVVMLALHIWSQAVDYTFGIGASIVFILSVFGRQGAAQRAAGKRRIWLFAAAFICTAGILFLGIQVRTVQKMGTFHPPLPGKTIPGTSHADQRTSPVLNDLHGFVIWSSNRFGNHDLVMLTLPELELTQLTTDPHTEYFPRISPDGTKVVFCRSQEPWVSQRNKYAWDTWLLELTTGKVHLLAKNANTPTWSADGEKVYFLRQANQFVEYTLADQKETVVFETGKNLPLSASITLETPGWSGNRQAMAVTLRGGARGTFVINKDKSLRQVGKGCELTWAPDSSYLYHVDHAKRGSNAFFKVNPETMTRELWYDAPGEYSHEYFPKVSNTGDMLVFGASTGGHEHDTADYEIFLWPIGTPMGNTARLSFHTGNDNWPDIYLY